MYLSSGVGITEEQPKNMYVINKAMFILIFSK